MRSFAGYAYVITAWLFFLCVVYQVFLAGWGLLGPGDMTAHIGFGYLVPLIAIVLMLVAWAAHPDRRTFRLTIVLLVLTIIQPNLPLLRDVSPFIAALHPVNALAIFWIGLDIARRSTALVRAPAVARGEVPVPQDEAKVPQEV